MDVNPQIKILLEQANAAGLPALHQLTPAEARAQVEAGARARANNPIPVAAVENLEIPTERAKVPMRLYRPRARPPLPMLVYFHGGGHVVGSLDTHDATARSLCVNAQCLVASIDYRLAPEAKFPAAVDDCFAATQWLAQHGERMGADVSKLAVGGDSAGGNLAAVTALMARDFGGPDLCFQLLVYPIADYACSSSTYEKYGSGFGILEADTMYWFRDHYLPNIDGAQDWRASPIHATSLSGLPPALVITAECDVLHDDGEQYAAKLAAADIDVTHHNYAGMIHGFFGMLGLADDAQNAHDLAAEHLKRAFNTGP
ncbi:MAG: alpha/beta hydrolase [Gammaproteobacteria bacterium]|nr:alpha/beta hydrolase [Gammaproteobacteria bacterium]